MAIWHTEIHRETQRAVAPGRWLLPFQLVDEVLQGLMKQGLRPVALISVQGNGFFMVFP